MESDGTTGIKSVGQSLSTGLRQGLEAAEALCVSRGHHSVTVEHWLLQLFREPGNEINRVIHSQQLARKTTSLALLVRLLEDYFSLDFQLQPPPLLKVPFARECHLPESAICRRVPFAGECHLPESAICRRVPFAGECRTRLHSRVNHRTPCVGRLGITRYWAKAAICCIPR